MAKKKFIVFDIDGTYFRSHLFWEVALSLARKDSLHPDIDEEILRLYDDWKNRKSATAFEDFDFGSITKIKNLLTFLDPKAYDNEMKSVLEQVKDQVYMYPKTLKEHLQSEGYMAIAISGSRMEEVTTFAQHHGFDDWIGQTFHRDAENKNYTGEVHATYKDKDILLKTFVEKHNLTYKGSYGVGDTSGDIGMLSVVDNPIAFNPNHSLLKHARQQGWKIVIERKSISYTLEQGSDGTYQLV
jgi:HAD superfamily phosphoserine phosphatase-like hydrolase